MTISAKNQIVSRSRSATLQVAMRKMAKGIVIICIGATSISASEPMVHTSSASASSAQVPPTVPSRRRSNHPPAMSQAELSTAIPMSGPHAGPRKWTGTLMMYSSVAPGK